MWWDQIQAIFLKLFYFKIFRVALTFEVQILNLITWIFQFKTLTFNSKFCPGFPVRQKNKQNFCTYIEKSLPSSYWQWQGTFQVFVLEKFGLLSIWFHGCKSVQTLTIPGCLIYRLVFPCRLQSTCISFHKISSLTAISYRIE